MHGLRGAVAAVLLAALAGCSGGGGDPKSGQSSSPAADRSAAGIVDQVDPAVEPIAEFTADAAGDEKGQVTVQVLSLEVQGDVMLLRVALTPEPLDGEVSSEAVDVFGMMDSMPVLSDIEHMVSYQPVCNAKNPGLGVWTAGDGSALPSTPRGVPFLYWAYFDAPNDRVDQLDLTLNDAWPVVEDVPVVWS